MLIDWPMVLFRSQYLQRVVLHEANGDRTSIEFSALEETTLAH